MEFTQSSSGTPPLPETQGPAVPAVVEPESIAQKDQTHEAQEPEQAPPQQQPISPNTSNPVPVMVNIEEPGPSTSSRAALNAGYNSDSMAHYYRSTESHQSAPEYAAQDTDRSRQNSSPSLSHHPLPVPNSSRPGSGLSSGPERPVASQQQHQQQQQQQHEVSQRQAAQANKNSVVIKVGMVGDAQIGKTSLMVKYVEGSWDEDYIQTLGELDIS